MIDKSSSAEDAQFYSELLRAYFDSANDAIFVLCDEMKIIACNKMTEQWLGVTEQQLTLHKQRIQITQLLGKNYDAKIFSTFFQNALSGQPVSFESKIKPDRGDERWTEINLTKVDIENGNMVIAVARDISERKSHLSTVKYLAQHDALTGLPNRISLVNYLHELEGNIVLFILDLDRFRLINESLGQQSGDLILRDIARRLQRMANDTEGEFVARYGGDQFALVVSDIDLSAALSKAETIRQQILQPVNFKSGKISLDCSIGIASSTVHSDDRDELIKLAVAAMYTAKSEKLGTKIYNPDTLLESSDHLHLVTDLRVALESGDVRPFYQPIVNMQSGAIRVEALARWQHPDHGFIPPDKFIYIAEEIGLINRLTTQILRTAIRECSEIIHSQSIENLSINLSPYCLSNEKLSAEIDTYLKQYGVKPGAVTLEVTESLLMSSISVSQNTIQSLHELGLTFSIDDFGTGYSSLAKLKQMPLKEIKIDKTFILDVNKNEDDAAITYASIQMAHGLGLEAVAEGIEDEATWLKLKEMGCDYGQGFWIAKPAPYDELLEWLSQQ